MESITSLKSQSNILER